jgi:hypothetical protein
MNNINIDYWIVKHQDVENGSAYEIETQLLISIDLKFIPDEELKLILTEL